MQLVPVYCSSPSVNPPPYIDCNFIFDLTIFELNRGWVRRRNPPRLAPNNLCLLTTRRFGSCSRHQHSALINCVREGRFYEEVLSLLENLWRYHQTLSIANLLYEADNDARERVSPSSLDWESDRSCLRLRLSTRYWHRRFVLQMCRMSSGHWYKNLRGWNTWKMVKGNFEFSPLGPY